MRYIGNKENIIEEIQSILQSHQVTGETFFDFFSGTTNVARFYKDLGYSVSSCDVLYMSYCLQKAYIENNTEPLLNAHGKLVLGIKAPKLFKRAINNLLSYWSDGSDEAGA